MFALFLTAGGCSSGPEITGLRRSVDALLDGLHAQGHFSGAVMIGHGGKVAYARAYGKADRNRLFDLETPADGGSLAKTVTAALVWRLVDAGSIALDDSVQRYVAEFPYPTVTIRHLLSHTAGTPDYDAFQPVLDAGEPVGNLGLQELMRRTSAQPLRPPGQTFNYCNICFDTLALLVERVTGRSYGDLIDGLLDDVGAPDAFLRPVRFSDWPGQRTLGFRSSLEGAEVFDVFDNEAFYGGSNIYFSVRDLLAWANAWVDGRALPASVLSEALAPGSIGDHPSLISLTSWYCSPDRNRCYYTGHHQGFFNFVYWDSARRLAVVFLSNNTMAPPIQPWLMRSLVALAEGRPAEPAPGVPPGSLEVDVPVVAGRYRLSGIGEVSISLSEGGAIMQIEQGPNYQLYPDGYGTLYAPGVDGYLTFEAREDVPDPVLIWTSVFSRAEGVKVRP
jgi:CubicO group peptidase (beta-lactamase class C family)